MPITHPSQAPKAVPAWLVAGVLAGCGTAALLLLPDSSTLMQRQIHDGAHDRALKTLASIPETQRASDPVGYALTELQLKRKLLNSKVAPATLKAELEQASMACIEHGTTPELLKEVLFRIPFAPSGSEAAAWLRKDLDKFPLNARSQVIQALVERSLATGDPRSAALLREELMHLEPLSESAIEGLVRLWRMAGQPEMGLLAIQKFGRDKSAGKTWTGSLARLRVDLFRELGRPVDAYEAFCSIYNCATPDRQDALFGLLQTLALEAGRARDLGPVIRGRAQQKKNDPESWRIYARFALEQGDQKAAIDAYAHVHKIDPSDTASTIQLAQLLEWNGRPLEAFEHYRTIVRQGGGSVIHRLFALNAGLFKDEELEESIRTSRDLVIQHGHALEAARIYAKLANYEQASEYYDHLVAEKKPDPAVLREYASMQVNLHEFERALALFEQSEKIAPGNRTARQAIAELQVNLGRMREAMATYKTLAMETADEELMSQYVTLAESLGELQELIRGLKLRITQDKEISARDYLRLASVELQAKLKSDSRKTLTAGVKRFPRDPDLILQAAYAHGDAGDFIDAAKLLETHPGLYSKTEVIEFNISLLVQAQDFTKAGAFLKQVRNQEALETPAMLEAQAQIHEANKQLDQAARFYKRLYDQEPSNILYMMNHARMLSTLGKLKEAREVIDPHLVRPTGEVLKLAAQVYGAGGDHKTAERLQKLYLESSPRDLPEAWGFLGDILLSRGDRVNARRAYRKGVDEMIKRVSTAQ